MLTIETEDTYRAILNSAPDAMVLINESGIIQLINTQTEKLFGYSREELLGKEIEILIPARYRAGHKEKKLSFIKSPEVREMGSGLELYALHKNGTEFLVEIALSYVEANGKTSACAAIRDISEKKAAENKFKALLESAPDAMVIADSEGRIELVNAQTEKMFGYSRAELIGTEVEKLIPQRFSERHRKSKMAFIKAPDVREMGSGIELFALRKDGTEFVVEVALSYIKTGDKTSACAAIRDISEKKSC
ncbi:PAS domain S-box protein [Oscillatoria amoena NRMC-F 0135]|nr:PAS domain S-box protein [Oscillatoria amoena NRMC-F 0135]